MGSIGQRWAEGETVSDEKGVPHRLRPPLMSPSLALNASTNGGFYSVSTADDSVYALAQCFRDVSSSKCFASLPVTHAGCPPL
ncbi:hypothetical protein QJS10_CPB17g00690 [Acorus calamus]|uniref:Gnk2-homologous domain-containing protein n=1 Tax=Acorus calamus TaxID=4465 RepID=A0AAV9CX70_ACOCL|nr:hypothetical protein QJS10_CPB17g00690 [Acorus calamus]